MCKSNIRLSRGHKFSECETWWPINIAGSIRVCCGTRSRTTYRPLYHCFTECCSTDRDQRLGRICVIAGAKEHSDNENCRRYLDLTRRRALRPDLDGHWP